MRRRRRRPLALDAYFFEEPDVGPPEQDRNFSVFDRFLQVLMWVSIVVVAFIVFSVLIVLQALYL